MNRSLLLILIVLFAVSLTTDAQRRSKRNDNTATNTGYDKLGDAFEGLKLRNIGPAFMSGRISDIVIHPDDENVWYVGVSSGGVWKSVNSGVTWTSIFDGQGSYSIGCITIDPHNPHRVWVGTGENDGGRHIAFGDGVYMSDDGGSTWNNVGLKNSEHISKILVHPEDPNTIYVASEGPLWTPGGQRGLYKSTDGGKTWNRTLGDNQWTGVTDLLMDPRNPDIMYAATWDRHRTVAAMMSGGPGTGIFKSTDSGDTWTELTKGLPSENMGKMGIALSPQNPDIVYAAIELTRRTGGVYRSSDQGASWAKMSDVVASATGPHYYQELYASPHAFDRIYLMDSRLKVSDDGGKTFRNVKNEYKHVDNHAIAFKPSDPDYIIIGTDGGVYETFDLAENWRFIHNLPVTQYYKVALDDTEPFYNIYGGTQDNNSQGGPSRTDNVNGIRNADWQVVLGGDGHQPATEPGNPDIIYAQSQQGNLSRIDMKTGESINIQPQPGADEDYERFNWDAPILVSPHKPSRLYFASQRVWKSENRGDSWEAISGDLTKNQERFNLPIMGRQQSWDNPWDVLAMSNYNTITSLSESPQQAGLLYAATDDGLINISEDGGENWRTTQVGSIPGVPATAFVNDIKADLHDVNTVYVVLDNHKYGDYKPYLAKSSDKGRTWQSIRSNLPDRTLLWRIVQDHVKPDLMFLGTEFGIYCTINGGGHWFRLDPKGATISFRDLAIQKRENDLVGASFGRGFFVLDDYSALREVTLDDLNKEGKLFSTRKAWWYVPKRVLGGDLKGSQGASVYAAPNPDFGAIFSFHLKEDIQSMKDKRQEKEEQLNENKSNIPFPGWEALRAEEEELEPATLLVVKDSNGNVVRRIEGPSKKGFHRVAWDLRYPTSRPVDEDSDDNDAGNLVVPGTFTVTLYKKQNGKVTMLDGPVEFEVERMLSPALNGASDAELQQFWSNFDELSEKIWVLDNEIEEGMEDLKSIENALRRSQAAPGDLEARYLTLYKAMNDLNVKLSGNPAKNQVGEKTAPSITSRRGSVAYGTSRSTYGPTATHKNQIKIIEQELPKLRADWNVLQGELEKLANDINAQGGPPIEK